MKWKEQALSKLDEGKKAVTGQKEKIMAGPVAEQLKDFCRKDEEFAQAVCQGGSFAECMKAVAKGVVRTGSMGHIEDLAAYQRAVEFYFPGAKVHMQLVIDLIGDAAPRQEAEPVEEKKPLTLNLLDFF